MHTRTKRKTRHENFLNGISLAGFCYYYSIESVPESITIRDTADRIHDRKTALMVIIKSRNNYTHHENHPVLS